MPRPAAGAQRRRQDLRDAWLASWLDGRPAPVAKAVAKLQGHLSSNVSNVPQRAALAAVAGSLDEVHMMREAFDARRKAIVAALNDIPGVHCPTPTGAFYAFPDVTGLLGKPVGENGTVVNTSSELAAALLDEAHVAAVPGEAFGAPDTCVSRMRWPMTSSLRACAGSAAGSAETVARGRARYLPRTPRHADYAPVETRDWTKSAIPANMASWRFCQVTDT